MLDASIAEYCENCPEPEFDRNHAALADLARSSAIQRIVEGHLQPPEGPPGVQGGVGYPDWRRSPRFMPIAGRCAGVDYDVLERLMVNGPTVARFHVPFAADVNDLTLSNSDGVVGVPSQLSGYSQEHWSALEVFEGHQHSKGLGGSLTPETYSPGSLMEPYLGVARYVGRLLSMPSDTWLVLEEVEP